jgi:hypothetical protein
LTFAARAVVIGAASAALVWGGAKFFAWRDLHDRVAATDDCIVEQIRRETDVSRRSAVYIEQWCIARTEQQDLDGYDATGYKVR